MRTTIVILILIIAVLSFILWYFNKPVPTIDRQATYDSLQFFMQQSAQLQAGKDSAVTALVNYQAKEDADDKKYEKKIRALEIKRDIAHTPAVDSLIKSNKELELFVAANDSLTSALYHEVDSAKVQIRIERQMYADILNKSDSLHMTEKGRADFLLEELKEADDANNKLRKEIKKQKKLKWLFLLLGFGGGAAT